MAGCLAATVTLTLPAAVVAAAPSRTIVVDLPAAPLDRALLALARTAGVEVVSTEAGLRTVRAPALHGTMTVAAALDRLLAGSGFRAITRGSSYRIIAAPLPRKLPPRPASPPPEPAPADIVVTASKQRVPLLRYPGSLTLVAGAPSRANGADADLSQIAGQLPILQSTQLGLGRNKVFIRGIADSSFNGTTQSTASVYLDDVQLNASGPDPALRLYDMQAVEILEGPQGTLYGAGAIGGVLRLTTRAPVMDAVAGSASGGVTLTQGGAAGYDLASMINVPVVAGKAALRGVVYRARDGGYIDAVRRGEPDANHSDTTGVRAALRIDPGDGWQVNTSIAAQRVATADGQYGDLRRTPFTQANVLAQPFTGRFLFGRATLAKDWGDGWRLVSATGIADYRTHERFDATGLATPVSWGPARYDLDNDKLLVSQELRLSRSLEGGRSWLVGISLLSDQSILTRSVGLGGTNIDIVGVTNVTRSASGFGEGTVRLWRDLSVTLGGRVTTARVDGEPSSTRRPGTYVRGRSTQRFDPTVALSYRLAPGLAAFARYQTGFRTGGLAVAQGVGRVANYDPDSIEFAEIGLRRLRSGVRGVSFAISGSTAAWTNIQADLISGRGQPYTTNLGNARIQTVEASVDWTPTPRLAVETSALYTYNVVYGAIADQSRLNNRRLPQTPPFAAHGAISYRWPDAPLAPRIVGSAEYVGRSVLGTGDLLDVSQGRYWTFGVSGALRWRAFEVTLGVENLTDAAPNRFAFGNPFGLPGRNETTPLRPRNLRIGVAMAW